MLDETPHPPAEAERPLGGDTVVGGPPAWTAAGLLVAAAALSLVALLPRYYAGGRLDRADEVVPVVAVALGWLAAGLAVANRHAGRVAIGGAAGIGIALADAGQRLADVGQGRAGAGPGLWLHVAAWGVGAIGAAVATTVAARAGAVGRPRRRLGGHVAPGLGVAAAVAGVAAAVAFVPSWDRYVVTSAVEPSLAVSKTLGYAFDRSNPTLAVAGNVATLAAFALVPLVAATWRPIRVGAALIGGVATVLAAQVLSAAVQVMETPDANQILLPSDIEQLRPTVSLHLTGWYDLEMAALLVLLIVAACHLHHPADQVAGNAPAGGGGGLPAQAGDGGWAPATPVAGPGRPAATSPSWGEIPPPRWPDHDGGTP